MQICILNTKTQNDDRLIDCKKASYMYIKTLLEPSNEINYKINVKGASLQCLVALHIKRKHFQKPTFS